MTITVTTRVLDGTLAERPAAGVKDLIFIATDVLEIYRDNGVSWDLIGVGWPSTKYLRIDSKAVVDCDVGQVVIDCDVTPPEQVVDP